MRKQSLILFLGILFLGCANEQGLSDGEGIISFGLKAGGEDVIISGTKSATVAYQLEVKNEKDELVVSIPDLNESNSTVKLLAKSYNAKIEGGKKVPVAFESPYYLSEKNFQVVANKTTTIDMALKLGNIKVTVEYTPQLAQYLAEANTTIQLEKGTPLNYSLQEKRAGYFAPINEENNIEWALILSPLNGADQEIIGKVEHLKANDHLILRFGIVEGGSDTGGLRLSDIVVNQTVTEAISDLVVSFPRFPEVGLIGGDIDEIQNITKTNLGEFVVQALAFPKLENLNMAHNFKVDNKNELDIIVGGKMATPLELGAYADEGIHIVDLGAVEGCSNGVKIQIAEEFLKKLPITIDGADPYEIVFTAMDNTTNFRQIIRKLRFNIIESDVITEVPSKVDVWTSRIDMTGRWDDVEPTEVFFEYCEVGASDWISVPATKTGGNKFKASILGLKPQTVYQIRARGTNAANIVKVTTAEPIQLYNSSLEFWSKEGSAYYPRENSSKAFWDTGNKGATTIGSNNPTEPEENDVIQGKAARLTSKVIVGNFAAGNLYVGQFIAVDILGGAIPEMTFGRPFSSRPYSLKGFYKYNSKTIDYAGGGKEEFKGRPDRFSMAILLTDGTNMPRYLKEKNKSPFDFDKIAATGTDGNIKAIASATFTNERMENGVDKTTALAMSDYAPFEMVLKYHEANKNLEVKYIVVIFSASKYGDFFTGGEGSCMLIDELELDYKFK